MTSFTVKQLADHLQADVQGDPQTLITRLATLASAQTGDLTFYHNPKYYHQLKTTQASAVILSKNESIDCPTTALIVDHPYQAYAAVAQLFEKRPAVHPGIHASAVVAPDAVIDPSASIGPLCVIGKGVVIEKNVVIGAACAIEEESTIGEGSHLYPHVTIYHHVSIGKHVIIHSGAVIGSDGFGMAKDQDKWLKIPQLGSVRIGDSVDIGANTTIDRGAIDDTIIEDHVILDNQIQIGHNVHIGARTAIAGCVGIAGSTHIGSDCLIGGATCINGHLAIVDRAIISGMSMVTHSIDKPGIYSSGTGIQANSQWRRSVARFHQLDQMAKRLNRLEKQVELSNE